MSVWPHFLAFLDVLAQQLATHIAPGVQRSMLEEVITGLRTGVVDAPDDILRTFFDQPPAHAVAVKTLDHSQFASPVPFPGRPFPLREIMAAFSHLPQAYGSLWLGLLDVAQAANVNTADCNAPRTLPVGYAAVSPAWHAPTYAPRFNRHPPTPRFNRPSTAFWRRAR